MPQAKFYRFIIFKIRPGIPGRFIFVLTEVSSPARSSKLDFKISGSLKARMSMLSNTSPWDPGGILNGDFERFLSSQIF